jgi:O-antigen/teichoic acid export membrane protein
MTNNRNERKCILRSKKAFINIVWNIIYECVNIVCAFILPRLILSSFGSAYNGLNNAVTQFLQVVLLFRAGIGGVTMAALYKPLALNDREQISVIVKTAELFLRKTLFLFAGFATLIAFCYPMLVREEFDYWFTVLLVLVMSIGTFANHFFGQIYQFLLYADQRQGFISAFNSIKVAVSTIVAVVLIKAGSDLIEVQIGSMVVFVIVPVAINIYTKQRYKIDTNVEVDNSKLVQRWDNFAQAVANFVCENTDLVILSFVVNTYELSVYSVYSLVLRGVYAMFAPFTQSLSAAFGDMFANGDYDKIERNLKLFESFVFALSTFLMGVTAAVIVPFVGLYTQGVNDVNYIRPLFAGLFILANLFKCYRTPYVSIVNAIGHFKQTKNAAIIEAVINILISLILVFHLGIIGVIIGTLFAYSYRTFAYAYYVVKNVVKRKLAGLLKRVILSLVVTTFIAGIPFFLKIQFSSSYIQWVVNSMIISVIAFILVVITEILFYRNDLLLLVKKFLSIVNIR